jgi:large-conductance mechanosensitive channel
MDTKKILHYIILACAVFILLYIITPREDKTEKYQNVVSSNGINSINTQTQLIPQQNTTDTMQLLQTKSKEPKNTNKETKYD